MWRRRTCDIHFYESKHVILYDVSCSVSINRNDLTALVRSESHNWMLSCSFSLTLSKCTTRRAVSSKTGLRSFLMIRVENIGFPSRLYVRVTYGSAKNKKGHWVLCDIKENGHRPEDPVVSIFLIPVARWIWTTRIPIPVVSGRYIINLHTAWKNRRSTFLNIVTTNELLKIESKTFRCNISCRSSVEWVGDKFRQYRDLGRWAFIDFPWFEASILLFITSGKAWAIGVTWISTLGRPIRLIKVVLTLLQK